MSPSFTIPASLKHRDIPLHELCAQNEGKRITVGVAIVSQPVPTFPAKILLVQRAAEEDVLPNVYELPGGNWEKSDSTILHTVAREAKEETGLTMTAILHEFEAFEYVTKRGPARQLNFLVQARQPDSGAAFDDDSGNPIPTLSPSEHQAYIWTEDVDSLQDLQMTDGMKTVVKNAFTALGKQK